MKKSTDLGIVTLADQVVAELNALQGITIDILRKKERLKNSRIFPPLAHFLTQSIRGYHPHLIMYKNEDGNVVDMMEEVASNLWLLSFSYLPKNYHHIANHRIALGLSTIDSLDQVINLNRQIQDQGGTLAVIACLTINRDREAIINLQQSPKRIICLTSVDPYEPSDLYLAPPIKELNAMG